jgi:polyhydroxyalkanoate synthesis regulator phasin
MIGLGIGEWPWRKPWDIIRGWKVSYNIWGKKHFLKRRIECFLAEFEWYIPTERTKRGRREVRMTYLRSRIDILEWRIKRLEEKSERNAENVR